ncbi:thioesterase II family protein [Streptomyces sp. NPDC004291]
MTAQIEDLWIRNLHPAPDAAVRLVCFPHAGGSAGFCFPVSRVLAPGADEYPGRRHRRTGPVVTDTGEPADRIAGDLAARADDRPTVLFGHGMGASVAFGVAHRLRARGTGPASPAAPHLYPYRDDAVHRRSGDGPVAELKDLSGTDAGPLRMVLPAVRGDHRAAETHRLRPVLALVGDGDPRVDVDEVRGRKRHITAGFAREVLPGGHFSLVREQAASPLPVAG